MPMVICTICGDGFYAKPRHLGIGWGKYCSKKCQYLEQKTGTYFACHTCKKQIYKGVVEQSRSKSGKFFCSKSCQTIWRNTTEFAGAKHANWQGGKASYRQIMIRSSNKHICAKCKNQDTRILAVHHKDKNRNNNNVSNLVWLCHNCHYLVHHYKNEAAGFVVAVA